MKRSGQRSSRMLWGGMLVGGLIAVGIALTPRFRDPVEETVAPVDITLGETARTAAAPKLEELRLRVVRKYPHARDAFTQGLIWPEGAMYAFIGVDTGRLPGFDDHQFAMDLLESRHVLVAPGSSFNVGYNNYFRITILPDAAILRDVFARIDAVLAGYASEQNLESIS